MAVFYGPEPELVRVMSRTGEIMKEEIRYRCRPLLCKFFCHDRRTGCTHRDISTMIDICTSADAKRAARNYMAKRLMGVEVR